MKEKEGKWVVRTWKGLTLFVLNEHMNDIVKIILCMYFIYGAYVINIDDKKSKVTNWVSLSIDKKTAAYFDSFGIEDIVPQNRR